MAAEKGKEAGSLKNYEEVLEESLNLTSKSFDPMCVIYAPSLEIVNENVDVYTSVSQFMKDFELEGEDPSRSPDMKGKRSSATVPESPQSHEGHDFTVDVSGFDSSGKGKPDESVNDAVQQIDTCVQSQHSEFEKLESGSQQSSKAKSESVISTTKTEKSQLSFSGRRRARKTVLTEMKNGFQQGPLSILRRSVQEKIKVRVWTRSVRNIRGVSTGYVVAFDKHMNLAMIDVDEIYRKPVGKHQRKTKPKDTAAEPVKSAQVSQEAEVLYPNTPWQPTDKQIPSTSIVVGGSTGDAVDLDSDNSNGEPTHSPADGIGNLSSAFSAMHVFEENEATHLLGVKSRKLLVRHLNQVLLRGEHIVAVSLVEPIL